MGSHATLRLLPTVLIPRALPACSSQHHHRCSIPYRDGFAIPDFSPRNVADPILSIPPAVLFLSIESAIQSTSAYSSRCPGSLLFRIMMPSFCVHKRYLPSRRNLRRAMRASCWQRGLRRSSSPRAHVAFRLFMLTCWLHTPFVTLIRSVIWTARSRSRRSDLRVIVTGWFRTSAPMVGIHRCRC